MSLARTAAPTNPRWRGQPRHGFAFDLDGTLTRPQHDFEAIRAALGVPRGRLILEYIAEQPAARAARMRADLEAIEVALARKAVAALGAVELISHLRARAQPLGILTRNSRDNAHAALDAIGLRAAFPDDCILGRDEATPKPEPDGLLRLCARWQLAPADCTMTGDSRLDLQAGRAAGCFTVHVTRSAEQWPQWTDLRVASLQAFANHLID